MFDQRMDFNKVVKEIFVRNNIKKLTHLYYTFRMRNHISLFSILEKKNLWPYYVRYIKVYNMLKYHQIDWYFNSYTKGLYYPNYEWILLGLYSDQWWLEYEDYLNQINCSLSSVTTVLNRALVLLPYPDDVGRVSKHTLLFTYIIIIYFIDLTK